MFWRWHHDGRRLGHVARTSIASFAVAVAATTATLSAIVVGHREIVAHRGLDRLPRLARMYVELDGMERDVIGRAREVELEWILKR